MLEREALMDSAHICHGRLSKEWPPTQLRSKPRKCYHLALAAAPGVCCYKMLLLVFMQNDGMQGRDLKQPFSLQFESLQIKTQKLPLG